MINSNSKPTEKNVVSVENPVKVNIVFLLFNPFMRFRVSFAFQGQGISIVDSLGTCFQTNFLICSFVVLLCFPDNQLVLLVGQPTSGMSYENWSLSVHTRPNEYFWSNIFR